MKGVFSDNFCTYITSNPGKTVFYTGVTNDLQRRLLEHYENRGNPKTFAGKYYCYRLVYFESYTNMQQAINRENEIKDLSRERKIELIKTINPKINRLKID
ncbi:MAG: GIY-YIG nuclease family protein [Bacteroidetes bacterium]|nr:GIY-YIG nuclease family protein [Bacteroidota bacterium]